MVDLKLTCGTLKDVEEVMTRPDGSVESCIVMGHSKILTSVGELTPVYDVEDESRRILQPLSLYPDGTVKAVALQGSTKVLTPLGEFEAEMVSFHKNGGIRGVFPLNGKLSGFWTEEEEGRLAKPLGIKTPTGAFMAKVISLYFHPCGALRSVTLWPGEVVEVETPLGPIASRVGVSFYENGQLRSLEPQKPTRVATPIGEFLAFDPDPDGISGDRNSLVFDEEGRIRQLSTLTEQVSVTREGVKEVFTPALKESLCQESQMVVLPLKIFFWEGGVAVEGREFSFVNYEVKAEPFLGDIKPMALNLGRQNSPTLPLWKC
ncbi:MAG: hypothetical protein C0609_08300 [Deltaproteobacteria bacterium]|nr:MAG: hypothetical protein C0609_08300 [Deltaproteobacteria bacterium]